MSRILYLDCFSGVAGDMLLGAFLDAGLPLDELRRALGSLAIEASEIEAHRVLRAGVSAVKFRVLTGHRSDHTHRHDAQDISDPHHPAHDHRTLQEIASIIDRSALSPAGRERAQALFRRLGEAEAAIHEVPLERVHLHEVGALDSIVDIVGAVFALDWFGVDRIVSSPLNVGSGTVECEHGTFPVPAPATARLLQGVPIYSAGPGVELVTPTGALLVTAYADAFAALPAMRIERIGYGAGDRDIPRFPNVLRIFVGTSLDAGVDGPSAARGGTIEPVEELQFEVDDMNPQIFGGLMDALHAAGAHEVFYTPVQMKKGRPGTLVTVVAPPLRREGLLAIIFRESTTIGVRYTTKSRERLDRASQVVQTPLGPVTFKLASRGGTIVNASPEYDDCAAIAERAGRPVKEVQAIAWKAYLEQSGSE